MTQELKVTRNYSFWKHPIKWWKYRKAIKMMNLYVNYQWQNGLRGEIEAMNMDMFTHGAAIMKNGKRVDPKKFHGNL